MVSINVILPGHKIKNPVNTGELRQKETINSRHYKGRGDWWNAAETNHKSNLNEQHKRKKSLKEEVTTNRYYYSYYVI